MNPTPTTPPAMPHPDQPLSDAFELSDASDTSTTTGDPAPEPADPITTWATMTVPEHDPPSTSMSTATPTPTPTARTADAAVSDSHTTGPGVGSDRESIRGTNWAVVAIGLACVVLAGTAIWQTVTGQLVDWERYGPFIFGGVGVLMVLAGTVGIIRRSR